jgi:hypothetical protein
VLLFGPLISIAQTITITGKVTDANTGDPIPFVNVYFIGTSIGTTSNFEGLYELQTTEPGDSLSASYIGYITRTKALPKGNQVVINFQLEESVVNLDEVVFIAGENPANPILRNVMDQKKNNDKRTLDAYEFETYTKIEIDVDNISDKFREKKFMKKITQVMDSVDQIAGEDGKPVLPMFISESISTFHFRQTPRLQHEKILKTRIRGVGVEDGTLVSQFIGSSFQQYNFYENWLNIVDKEFVSPIADGWRIYYDYDLIDSTYIGEDFCYRLDFYPKSEQDLAFTGSMWITKKEYALKQIDATVAKTANLNYIEKIKIQQELEKTTSGPWLPVKNRVLIDVGEVTQGMAGILAKFYTSNKDIVVNQPNDVKFYVRPIEVAEDFTVGSTDEYWEGKRHEPLTPTEISVYQMIDTLNSIPVVRTYTDILKVLVNGYKRMGKFDFGPYLALYANNSIEGSRIHLGGRTNIRFSDKWILGGYVAYGFKDEKFKYRAFVERIFDRYRWTTLSIEHTRDIDQVGLEVENLLDNFIFLAATRFGDLNRPYYHSTSAVSFQREVWKGITPKITLRHRQYEPQYNFAYYRENEVAEENVATNFETTEAIVQVRFAKDELHVQDENQRISLGTQRWPVFTVRYVRGIKNFLGGDFSYNKLGLNVSKDINMGILGTSNFSLTAEKIFETVPYPLLANHIGNESLFFTSAAYNLMNYSEFVSDEYLSFRYQHHFEGFILNRIPLMKKLKWRLLATANVLYGSLTEENLNQQPPFTSEGLPTEPIGALGRTPYIELGYGVENILKVLRVDFFHRLNYLDNPGANSFGVKISFQFIL